MPSFWTRPRYTIGRSGKSIVIEICYSISTAKIVVISLKRKLYDLSLPFQHNLRDTIRLNQTPSTYLYFLTEEYQIETEKVASNQGVLTIMEE